MRPMNRGNRLTPTLTLAKRKANDPCGPSIENIRGLQSDQEFGLQLVHAHLVSRHALDFPGHDLFEDSYGR